MVAMVATVRKKVIKVAGRFRLGTARTAASCCVGVGCTNILTYV